MPENGPYSPEAPTREYIDAMQGDLMLEFGTDWCGHCQAAQAFITEALVTAPGLRHLKVEDGPGRPLGRSFRVKLWPTLVLLRSGQEIAREVRPGSASQVTRLLQH